MMVDHVTNIIIAALGFAGALAGAYFSNRKAQAVQEYRLAELEKKVDKHNNLIERTYQLEERSAILEEKIKVANHRIDDLEGQNE
jgi:uncharacterized membrane protein